MAIVVSSGQMRPDFAYHPILAVFRDAVASLVPRLKSADDGERARRRAIEMLSSGEAGPDMLEWAERYLCGMAEANAEKFLAGRKRQE